MRTKTLLLTVAIGAVGAASSMAQVYSVNAVGYVNVTIYRGFNQISAPMKTASRTLTSLIPAASNPQADQAVFYKFGPGGYTINTLDIAGVGDWDPSPNETIPDGSGGFLLNSGPAPFTLTWVGEVNQGTLVTTAPAGFSFVSSYVPQSGAITTDLKITPHDQDICYQYVNDGGIHPTGYLINTYDLGGTGGWDPSEPFIEVGKSVLITSGTGFTSTRVFSVN